MDGQQAPAARAKASAYVRTMEIRVLGPLEAPSDGEILNLGGPRQRALLALLVAGCTPADLDGFFDGRVVGPRHLKGCRGRENERREVIVSQAEFVVFESEENTK